MIDHETSLRIQQDEVERRFEQRRAHREAAAAKERRILSQTDEAAAAVAANIASSSVNGDHKSYQEDIERRARILAFMCVLVNMNIILSSLPTRTIMNKRS